ncbi:MAG: S-methyl-5'-thioinosine phosphorylase [Gammaproteobacteria bacterium]
MDKIAIIGGSGLSTLTTLEEIRREVVYTPYGSPSGPLTHGRLYGREVTFLARHGYGQTIPPHKVNYRANLWALNMLGVSKIIAVSSVGGIRDDLVAGSLAVPEQIIDYTTGRACTFFEQDLEMVTHIDFTEPYDAELRSALLAGATAAGVGMIEGGVYAAVQGPRLETAAEVNRLEGDGADMVGMTGMPEAALARELGVAYATLAVVSNRAAGRGERPIHAEIDAHLRGALAQVLRVLEHALPML